LTNRPLPSLPVPPTRLPGVSLDQEQVVAHGHDDLACGPTFCKWEQWIDSVQLSHSLEQAVPYDTMCIQNASGEHFPTAARRRHHVGAGTMLNTASTFVPPQQEDGANVIL